MFGSKKQLLRRVTLALMLLVPLGLQSCGTSNTTAATQIVAIRLTPDHATLHPGAKQTYGIQQVWNDGTESAGTAADAVWTSSDLSVATVSTAGQASALKVGMATVTATLQGMSATSTLQVTARQILAVHVTPTLASLAVGGHQQLQTTAVYDDGSSGDVTGQATWTSSDNSIVAIDATGLATAIKGGQATLTATVGTLTDVAAITVTQRSMVALVLEPAKQDVTVAGMVQINAFAIYDLGPQVDVTTQATWKSLNADIATVNASGQVTGLKEGAATITASLAGIDASSAINVKAKQLMALQVTPALATVAIGGKQAFLATGNYDNGTTDDLTAQVQWTSSDPGSVSIDATGLATGLAGGKAAVIHAAYGGKDGTASLVVSAATVSAIALTPANAMLAKGQMQEFQATASMTDGTQLDVTLQATWTSTAPAIATVNAQGHATGVAKGSCAIHATLNGITGSAALNVSDATVTSVQIAPSMTTSFVGGPVIGFSAIASYSDATYAVVTTQVTWQSSDPTVATVNAQGKATPIKQGSVQISAAYQGVISNFGLIAVGPAVVSGLVVMPATATLAKGTSVALKAVATLSDGTSIDLTSAVAWQSSDLTVATVTANGLVTGLKAGTAMLTATFQGKTASSALTVSPATLQSLAISPTSGPPLQIGASRQFTVSGTYSDSSVQDLTNAVVWSSSDPAKLAVSNAVSSHGLATALTAGNVTVSAALGTIAATAVPVIVQAKSLVAIQVTPALATVAINGTQAFVAMANFDDGSNLDVTHLATWTASDTSAVAIDTNGVARGLVGGKTVLIQAVYQAKQGSASLVVSAATVASIALNPAQASLAKGQGQVFQATATMTDGALLDVTTQATWTSSDNAMATVDEVGHVLGVGVGKPSITATFGGKSGSAFVTVTDAVVTGVQVTPGAGNTFIGGPAVAFTATASFSDLTSAVVTTQASWQSSAPAIATVDAQGKATALTTGFTQVTATYQGMTSAPATLSVGPAAVVSLEVLPAAASIAKGTNQVFQALATLSDGNKVDMSSAVSWQSSNLGLATISSVGVASGLLPGAVTLTATFQGKYATSTLTVTPATLTSLDIAPAVASALPLNATRQYKAIGTYSDKTTQDVTEQVIWQTSNASQLAVSNASGSRGLVTALAAGTPTLWCSAGNIVAPSVQITINTSIILSSITLWPSNATLVAGQAQRFVATGHYSDGSAFDVTASAIWDVVDANDAAIAGFASVSGGLVAALQSTANVPGGQVRIKAHIGSVSTYASLVIKASVITGMTVTCDAPLSCLPSGIGYQVSCVATANFDDNTTGDVTTTASWSSSATGVATTPVLADGRAWTTIVGNGPAVITAAQGGQTSVASAASTLGGAALNLNAITVGPPTTSRAKGFTQQYQASGLFTGGGCDPATRDLTRLVTWTSSIPAVAPISNAPGSKGLASAATPGTTTIAATLGLISGSAQLVVSAACLGTVRIEQVNPTWPTQVQVPLTVVGYYSDAPLTPAQLQPGTIGAWSSNNVNPATWMLSIGTTSPGAVTFSVLTGACSEAVTDTTTVTVDPAALPSALVLAPATAQITKGAYQDFSATATYETYGTFNVSAYSGWSVAPQIGLSWGQQAAGLLERFQHQGTTSGVTTVAAAYKNRTATASLQVSGSTVSKVEIIEVQPAIPQLGIPIGLNLRFRARVTWSDGSYADNPSGLAFFSSDPAKLGIISGNLATTLAPSAGTDPTVTATYGAQSSIALPVKISTATLVDLQFSSPSGGNMPRNAAMPLTVTGIYSDGSSFDVSALVTAGSGNASVVQVAIAMTGVTLTSFSTTTTQPVKITFMKDMISRDFAISVNGACLAALSLAPAVGSMAIGQQVDFIAKATDTGGNTLNVSQLLGISWSDSNATLLNLGNVTGPARRYRALAKGTSPLTASFTSQGVCAGGVVTSHTLTTTATVNVTDATPVSVQILPQPTNGQTARRVPVGQTVQFHAMATLTDGSVVDVSSGYGTMWSTQKSAFAWVTDSGLLYGQGVGLTILTATTANGKSANLIIDVQSCGAPIVTLAASANGKLPVGATRMFTASALYGTSAGCTASTSERIFDVTSLAQFVASDPTVVSISSGGNQAGKALALSGGTVQISANYLGVISNYLSLTAVAVSLEAISINAPSGTYKDGAFDITVSALYTDGGSGHWFMSPPPVVWNIFDPTVVSIDDGTLTGLKQGTTKYFAQVGPIVSNTLNVQISGACVQSVQLNVPSGNVTWPGGVPFTMVATCTTSDSSVMSCRPDFSSDDPGHVIDELANFQSLGSGVVAFGATPGQTATLRATVPTSRGGCVGAPVQSSAVVTTGSAVLASMSLSPTAVTIARGLNATFATTGTFAAGTGSGAYNLTSAVGYTSNNPGIAAALNDGHGTVHAGVTDGTALISATYLGVTSTFATLTVSGKTPDAVYVLAEPNLVNGSSLSATYPIGGYRLQLSAVAHYSDNTWGDVSPSVSWSLKATALADASIDANGLYGTSSVAGDQVVVATMDTLTREFTIHNVAGALVNVTVTNSTGGAPTTTIPKGLTEQYTATFKLSGSTQAGPYWGGSNFTWVTGDSTLASVAIGGTYHQVAVLHALDLGTTSLSAKVGVSTSGPLAITITDTVPVSLTCQPDSTAVTAGSRVQLRAIATMADSTTNDVSASVDWNHPVTALLSIDSVGVASALMAGDVAVKPQLGGIVASNACAVSVTVP